MADKLPYHRKPMRLDMPLDGVSKIRHPSPDLHPSDRVFQGVPSHRHQPRSLIGHLSNSHSQRRVTIVVIQHDTHVNRDDVAVFQGIIGRNAMNDSIVDRGTERGWVSVIPLERRNSPELTNTRFRQAVEIMGRYTGGNHRLELAQHLRH